MRRDTTQTGHHREATKDTMADALVFDNTHCRLRSENGMSACVTTILGHMSTANDRLETRRAWSLIEITL